MFQHPKVSFGLKSLRKYNFEYESDFEPNRYLYSNEKGRKALVLRESVPTFDAGDREWDSYKKLYLIPEKGHVIGFLERGGYKVAQVEYFSDIRWGNMKTRKFMDRTKLFD